MLYLAGLKTHHLNARADDFVAVDPDASPYRFVISSQRPQPVDALLDEGIEIGDFGRQDLDIPIRISPAPAVERRPFLCQHPIRNRRRVS